MTVAPTPITTPAAMTDSTFRRRVESQIFDVILNPHIGGRKCGLGQNLPLNRGHFRLVNDMPVPHPLN